MNTESNAAESIAKKLSQEEEWLQNFEKNISKSAQIRQGIEVVVEKFDQRLGSLEKTFFLCIYQTGSYKKTAQYTTTD
uniref:Oligoendopeptidase F n=1 Tax=Caenorhabditis tropicalis TaxID=1561998 RepID=A0A1I7TJY3_9PELO